MALHPADAPWPEGLAQGFVALLRGAAGLAESERAIARLHAAAAQQVAERASTLFTQIPAGDDLRVRSLRQTRLFERLGLSETLFFADASASMLDTLRLGPKWAHRTRAPLSLALMA
jgi:hypothetical protein